MQKENYKLYYLNISLGKKLKAAACDIKTSHSLEKTEQYNKVVKMKWRTKVNAKKKSNFLDHEDSLSMVDFKTIKFENKKQIPSPQKVLDVRLWRALRK